MATGANVITPLHNIGVAPTAGTETPAYIYLGSGDIQQACTTFILEVVLWDPNNAGDPATFEIQLAGQIVTSIPFAFPPLTDFGDPITEPGFYTVTAPWPVTNWTANLVSLAGGTSPTITVSGVASE